jgi:hypothetical protein
MEHEMSTRKWFTNDQRGRGADGTFEREKPKEYFDRNIEINSVTGCWNWIGNRFNTGYGAFKNRTYLGHPRAIPASRASWMMHKGPIPKGLWICHTCDNPPCVNPDHLFLGTAKDDMVDCKNKGRTNKGEDRPQAKLTEEIVREARRIRQTEQTPWRDLAKQYGVTLNCIRSAIEGTTWAHVDEPIPDKVRAGGDRRSPEALAQIIARKGPL